MSRISILVMMMMVVSGFVMCVSNVLSEMVILDKGVVRFVDSDVVFI